MANQKKNRKLTTDEKYLVAVFSLLKKREHLVVANKKMTFNDTEIRMITEIIMAKAEGKRLISTELAKRLGVTRSAISQIVNRLEENGVVKRIPDEVDKKIAYVEITDAAHGQYEADFKLCSAFIGRVVERFGKDKFEQMCALVDEFISALDDEKNKERAK